MNTSSVDPVLDWLLQQPPWAVGFILCALGLAVIVILSESLRGGR